MTRKILTDMFYAFVLISVTIYATIEYLGEIT